MRLAAYISAPARSFDAWPSPPSLSLLRGVYLRSDRTSPEGARHLEPGCASPGDGKLSAPIRAGTHANTAFAMVHMLDYARAVGDSAFDKALVETARRFYLNDQMCPTAYEPSGEDFISPCLAEADLMRRVLPPAEFAQWLSSFLPAPDSPAFGPLIAPPTILDPHDPRIGHLIGLDFQRAWSLEGIARAVTGNNQATVFYHSLSAIHCEAGLRQMFEAGYGGEHWLASFALYMLSGPLADDRLGSSNSGSCATAFPLPE